MQKLSLMSQNRSGAIINNAFLLYIRSFLTMIIGIYTSRILLKSLGVEDFGIYNLVAGLVAMFASLKSVFASSIQRFLNYAKGKNDQEQENKIFNISILIHSGLGLMFALIVEVVGNWFIKEKLNIPPDSISIAFFVFHCAVITTTITVASIPFDAVVIANEKFKYYAWLTLIDAVLKFLIVYLLALLPFHRLCSYSVLLLIISLIDITANIIYCRRFKECKIHLLWDTTLLKKIASFSAWNFLGNTAFTFVNEGLNVILNIFGGVAINAGRGIAYQVKSAVQTLCNNIFVAVQPVIVQQAVQKEKSVIFSNILRLSKINFFVTITTVIPIFVFSEYILKIWLGQVPPMSTIFVKLLMMYCAIRSLHSPIDLLFKSYGDIKKYQIIDSLVLIMSIPISYCLLKFNAPLYWVFIIMSIVEVMNLLSIVLCAKSKLGFDAKHYFYKVGVPCCLGFVLMFFLAFTLNSLACIDGFIHFITILLIVVVVSISISLLLIGKDDRLLIISFIKEKLRK